MIVVIVIVIVVIIIAMAMPRSKTTRGSMKQKQSTLGSVGGETEWGKGGRTLVAGMTFTLTASSTPSEISVSSCGIFVGHQHPVSIKQCPSLPRKCFLSAGYWTRRRERGLGGNEGWGKLSRGHQ